MLSGLNAGNQDSISAAYWSVLTSASMLSGLNAGNQDLEQRLVVHVDLTASMLSGLNAGNQASCCGAAAHFDWGFNAVRLERRKSGADTPAATSHESAASMLSGLNAGNQECLPLSRLQCCPAASMLSGLNAGNQVMGRRMGRTDGGELQCCPA